MYFIYQNSIVFCVILTGDCFLFIVSIIDKLMDKTNFFSLKWTISCDMIEFVVQKSVVMEISILNTAHVTTTSETTMRDTHTDKNIGKV